MKKERKKTKLCIRCCNENTIIDAQLYSQVNFIILILSHLRHFWALDYCTMHASAAIALGLLKCIAFCLSVIDCLMFICVLATGQSFLHTHFHFQALCFFSISNWLNQLLLSSLIRQSDARNSYSRNTKWKKDTFFFLQYQQHEQNTDK